MELFCFVNELIESKEKERGRANSSAGSVIVLVFIVDLIPIFKLYITSFSLGHTFARGHLPVCLPAIRFIQRLCLWAHKRKGCCEEDDVPLYLGFPPWMAWNSVRFYWEIAFVLFIIPFFQSRLPLGDCRVNIWWTVVRISYGFRDTGQKSRNRGEQLSK